MRIVLEAFDCIILLDFLQRQPVFYFHRAENYSEGEAKLQLKILKEEKETSLISSLFQKSTKTTKETFEN